MIRIARRTALALVMGVAAASAATSDADFAIRVVGGGSKCAGAETTVDVLLDLNRSGSNRTPVRGFALAICHVPYQLKVVKATRGKGFDPAAGGVQADFLVISEQPRGVIQTVIVDLTEDRGILPVNAFHSLSISYQVLDAADPALMWPCDGAIGSPPLILTFSTGRDSYYPPPENLVPAEISSPCNPIERAFRITSSAAEPLRVDADTGTGTTTIDVALKEDPVACCPPRLLQGMKLNIALPSDLRIVRILSGDLYVLKLEERQGPGCTEVEMFYAASQRFGEKKTVMRVEVATRSEIWRGVLVPATREILFPDHCVATAGVRYVDGRDAPFTNLSGATLALSVQPRRPFFLRGDANADGARDIADAINLLSWLYRNQSKPPPCIDAADANDDGRTDIGDPIAILTRIFGGGGGVFPEPSRQCGRDPTPDKLDCGDFPACAP